MPVATFPTFKPFQIHNHSIVFDPAAANIDFADAISSFKLSPQQSIATWKGGRPSAVYSDISAAVWQATISLAQDWDALASFANYLIANAGKSVPVDYRPKGATGAVKVSATLILAAPEVGGDIDAWAATAITCGVVGVPVFTGAS